MTRLEAIGERKIIELILKQQERMPNMPIPFGDDVSAYTVGNNQFSILKTDMLVDKTDVPTGMSLWQAARKAVVMNVSDFAAKGATPKAVLVSLGLPKNLTIDDIKEIGAGLNAGAREYDAYVVGGDTNEASDLVISLSVFGLAERETIMLRSGAKPGDIVAVTGCFGKASAGLRILLNNLKASKVIRSVLVDSVLMPKARLKEGLALCQTRAVTASIDSSDGLAWSLHEISKASGVGFFIDKLPTAEEAEEFAKMNKLSSAELTLYGGEEYELVLTIKPKLWRNAERAIEKVGGKLLPIGKTITGTEIFLETENGRQVIKPRGWEHFRKVNV